PEDVSSHLARLHPVAASDVLGRMDGGSGSISGTGDYLGHRMLADVARRVHTWQAALHTHVCGDMTGTVEGHHTLEKGAAGIQADVHEEPGELHLGDSPGLCLVHLHGPQPPLFWQHLRHLAVPAHLDFWIG